MHARVLLSRNNTGPEEEVGGAVGHLLRPSHEPGGVVFAPGLALLAQATGGHTSAHDDRWALEYTRRYFEMSAGKVEVRGRKKRGSEIVDG